MHAVERITADSTHMRAGDRKKRPERENEAHYARPVGSVVAEPAMLKSYLRYELRDVFGVVCAPERQVLLDEAGKLAFCLALQDVIVWNLRLGTPVSRRPAPRRASRSRWPTLSLAARTVQEVPR